MNKDSNSSRSPQLTMEEQVEIRDLYRTQTLQKYLTEPIQKKIDLELLLAALNRPKVGTKVVCGNPSHVAPFDVLFNVISGQVRYYVIWASRSGSKTYLFGGLVTWVRSCQLPKYKTKILGGSKEQSILSYEAMSEFKELTDSDGDHCNNLMKTKAEFTNGSSVSISPASITSVRGPHQQCLLLDEVDEIDAEVYEAALSQPQSLYGHPASLGMFSTNHNINGQMDKAIAKAVEKNHAVYRYCCWETMESCRDYTCSTCDLSGICPGKAMKEADGYYKVEDFIEKLNSLSFSTLSRDWLCIKVGMGDTVYDQEWDEEVHLVSVKLRELPVVLSIDWGGVAPFSIGVWQKAPKKYGEDTWVRVAELFLTSGEGDSIEDRKKGENRAIKTNSNLIKIAKTRPWWRLVKEIVVDNSRPDLIEEWRQAIPRAKIISPAKDVDKMIEASKDALKPVLGDPKVLVNRICVHFRREMMLYKVRNDRPVDRDNHCMDEFGYFVMAKIRRVEESYFGVIQRSLMPLPGE